MTTDEQTIFDPGFGSASNLTAPQAGAPSLLLRIEEPGLPAVERELAPGAHVVGNDPGCAVLLTASGVSSSHARLLWHDGSWWVEDLGSRNGTYVDKQVSTRPVALRAGTDVHVGPVRLAVLSAGGRSPVAAAPEVGGAVAAPRPGRRLGAIAGGLGLVLAVVVAVAVVRPPAQPVEEARPTRDPMAAFRNAISSAVKAMQAGNHRDAAQYLAAAHSLKQVSVTQTLMELNTILTGTPTEQITELIERCDRLAGLEHALWRDTGVTGYAGKQLAHWKGEQANATFASKFEAAFARGDWEDARRWYAKVARDSEFRFALMNKEKTCRQKLAVSFRDAGNARLEAARADEAIVLYDKAMAIAPNDMQNELITLRQEAVLNQRWAQALRKGQEHLLAGHLQAAIEQLESIPERSRYFRQAVELLGRITRMQVKARAEVLYHEGKGEQALKLLATAVSDELVGKREHIARVVRITRQAQELTNAKKHAEANELWRAVVKLVGDSSNAYHQRAAGSIVADIPGQAKSLAEEARRSFRQGRFVRAGQLVGRSLQLHRNPLALDLRKQMVRRLSLRYSIARQKWQDSGAADRFLAEATLCYRWLRATDPIHELLPKMADAIAKAGGTVPSAETPLGDDDDE